MSTITERAEQGAETSGQASRCEATTPWLGIDWDCGDPAVGRYRRACVHEHMRDGWLCQQHVNAAHLALCRDCHELAGDLAHECPVTLTLITEVSA